MAIMVMSLRYLSSKNNKTKGHKATTVIVQVLLGRWIEDVD